jgi:hypothetical protein
VIEPLSVTEVVVSNEVLTLPRVGVVIVVNVKSAESPGLAARSNERTM